MIEYLFVIYMHDMQHSLKVKHYFFLLKSNICLQIKRQRLNRILMRALKSFVKFQKFDCRV